MNPILCDICQAPMTMTGQPGISVEFKCTKCPQWLGVNERGISCTILHTLWPSAMDENGPMFREQYLPDWLRKREYRAAIMFAAGFWNEAETAAEVAEARKTAADWFLAHPLKLKRPWWRFWA